jgi:uncharacterized repeat protein (TIGR01451 family)
MEINLNLRIFSCLALLAICLNPLTFSSVSVIVPGSPAAQTAPNDWPMLQHDPAHSGRTPATIVNTGPLYLQWAYSFGERVEVEAQPIVSNGVIYQGVMNGEMHAINASTGQAIWVRRPGGPISHTAAVVGNLVYFGSLDGKIYALSTADGHTVWSYTTGAPVVSSPVVVNGRLFIGSNDGSLYALDALTGAKLWNVPTGGPVASSPAVYGDRVYFGSEDLHARCVNATNGSLIWNTPLSGQSMRNTYPVLSNDGNVVIFLTIKPGQTSYIPAEEYPGASTSADPVNTWNSYYQSHPLFRYLFYLNGTTGADLWNRTSKTFVPLPIPYWGVIHPIIGPDGYAYFPAPSGAAGYDYALDHDNRLFKVNLSTGVATQIAGGSMAEFQLRPDEVGRQVFSGNDYYYTISEDLGVFRPSAGTVRTLFSNGDASGYNFGTHMNPLSPLPSRHLWRYGGVIAMGGVPNASAPVVANNMVYYNSYGWLYAVGTQNRGYNPATSFPARDGRLYELTYPRQSALTLTQIRSEISQRVSDIIALGVNNPPIVVKWDQPMGKMVYNETPFEVYGFEADLVRVLSEAYPFLSTSQQAQLRTYLSQFVNTNLLNSAHYSYATYCLAIGDQHVETDAFSAEADPSLTSCWWTDNENLVAQRLYALYVYADATGDWSGIQSNWSLIQEQFMKFYNAYDASLGFCRFQDWHVKRLSINSQILAAQAVKAMATHFGYTSIRNQATTLYNNLLAGRRNLANFVPNLYDTGQLSPASIRLNADGTINYSDIMGQGSPYNNHLIPYDATLRDRNTDVSQVNWWDGSDYQVDEGAGYGYYQALSGYFPLSRELADYLRANLLSKTQYYVKSYEINNPWWWMADYAHHTTSSGEHLYESPMLSWTMFQVKLLVLQENWDTLVRELPEPVSWNSKYDLFRLENLTLLVSGAVRPLDLSTSAITSSQITPSLGNTITFTITLRNTGDPSDEIVSVSNALPNGLNYVSSSLTATSGSVDASNPANLKWSGPIPEAGAVTIQYQATVSTDHILFINNIVNVQSATIGTLEFKVWIMMNPEIVYVPITIDQ